VVRLKVATNEEHAFVAYTPSVSARNHPLLPKAERMLVEVRKRRSSKAFLQLLMIKRRLRTYLHVDRNTSSITVKLWNTIKKQESFNQLMGFFQKFSKFSIYNTTTNSFTMEFLLNLTLNKVCISMQNLCNMIWIKRNDACFHIVTWHM
jgi:hypothetical protein